MVVLIKFDFEKVRNMMEVLYMAVTADKYELPLVVGNSVEVAAWANMSINSLQCAVASYKSGRLTGRLTGMKFVSVRTE